MAEDDLVLVSHIVTPDTLNLMPRYPGTPREYWWTRVDEWPQARRGGAKDIDALVRKLHAYLADG